MHICIRCDSDQTSISTGRYPRPRWYKYNDGYLCNKCYMKIIHDPKWRKITSDRYNPRHMLFKDKIISLNVNPRKGICQICGKKIGDTFIDYTGKVSVIKLTVMHHKQYHDEDPLKDTIELCVPCHRRQHS